MRRITSFLQNPVIYGILGFMLVRLGKREVNFFASGKVSIRMVNDIEEGKKLVNSIRLIL